MLVALKKLFARLTSSATRLDFWTLLIDRAARLVLGTILAGLLGRHLGAEAYGWINFASSAVLPFIVVAHLGFDTLIVQMAAKDPAINNRLMGAVFLARLAVGLFLSIVCWVLAGPLSGGVVEQKLLIEICALSAFTPALIVPSSWFQSRTEQRFSTKASLWAFLIASGVKLAAILLDANVSTFAWLALFDALLQFGFVYMLMRLRGGRFTFEGALETTSSLLKQSWPVIIGGLAVAGYHRIDQLMLGWLMDARTVGVYAAASRLSENAYVIPGLICASAQAKLALLSKDESLFVSYMQRYFSMCAAVGFMLTLLLVLIAPFFLPFLYGEEFSESGFIAQIHVVTVLFISLGYARGSVLVAKGFLRFDMLATLAGLVVNVILNLLLIPRLGVYGAALSSVVAQAISVLGSSFLYPPTRSIGRAQIRALLRPRLEF